MTQVRKLQAKGQAVPGSHEWGYANTGTEQVGVRVTLLDGEHKGHTCSWYGYFTEKSEERTKEQLKIAGWDDTQENVIDLPGLGSTEFSFSYEEETNDQGDVYLSGSFMNRIAVAMKNKMDDQQKKAFASRLRGASAPTQRRAPRSNGSDFDAPPPRDEDLGF